MARGGDVDKVVGHVVAVIVQILAGAHIHTTIHLTGVGAYDFAAEVPRQHNAAASLAAGRGAYNCKHRAFVWRCHVHCAIRFRLNIPVSLGHSCLDLKKGRSSLLCAISNHVGSS